MNNINLKIPFLSIWDGGVAVESDAIINIITGEITNIRTVAIDGLDICEEQYIIMNDERVYVYENENGFDYWADIEGIYNN